MRIKVIYPDGEVHELDVHEVIIKEKSAKIYSRTDEIIIAADDSDEKW